MKGTTASSTLLLLRAYSVLGNLSNEKYPNCFLHPLKYQCYFQICLSDIFLAAALAEKTKTLLSY